MSTEQSKGGARLGRRLKSDDERKSETLRLRVREDMKRRLEAEATKHERSVSEEAEKRLANSFELEPLHRLVYGGGPASVFLQTFVSCLMSIQEYEISPGQRAGNPDWQSSDATRAAVRGMIQVLVNNLAPKPRTAAEISASAGENWSAERQKYHDQTLNLMQAMAVEMTKRELGLSDDALQISDPEGASAH